MKSTSGLRPRAAKARIRSAAKMKLPLRMATATKSLGIAPAMSGAGPSRRSKIWPAVNSGSSRTGSAIGLGEAELDIGRVGGRAFELGGEVLLLMAGKARLLGRHDPAIK